ncbi:MAG: hypothetical protein FWF92_04815 [Oscillospiraceae bacterium]|nr:hypothetical protein [Oscillospiraceae bacterium]
MDNDSITNITTGNKINSAEIIEYAKQKIDSWNEEYKGAAPGEFDFEIFNKMTEIIKNLTETAIKLEALEILSNIKINENDDTSVKMEIARAINGMMTHSF